MGDVVGAAHAVVSEMSLSEAIERLLIATRAEGRSPRTVQAYAEKLGHLMRYLGDPPVEAVTVDDLRRFLAAQYEKGLSAFTVKTRVRAFKRLFNFLEAEGILESNPAQRVKTPQPKRGEPKGIRWGDFLALLDTTGPGSVLDLRDRALLLLLFDTGCRVGGLVGLRVDDLDLEHLRAVVTEKGGKTRLVFFQEETAQALAAWLAVRPQDRGPWLFVSFKGKYGRLTVSGVYHVLKGRGKLAGCTGPVNPHAFRHGFARAYLLSGGDLGTLADILGHSTVEVTKAYYGIFTVAELQAKHAQHSPIVKLRSCKNEQ
jgi:site-specific recombinase XerD